MAAACLAARRQDCASPYAGDATATKTSLPSTRPTTSFHQAGPGVVVIVGGLVTQRADDAAQALAHRSVPVRHC